MVNGKEVHRIIKSKISSVKSNYDNLTSEIRSIEGDIDGLMSQREDCFIRLAAIYLPELDAQNVQNTLREVQGEVRKVFKSKEEKRTKLMFSMQEALEKKGTLEDTLDNVTDELNEKAARRDELKKTIAAELAENINYTNLKSMTEEALKTLDRYKTNFDEFKHESDTKLVNYKTNKLFIYLLNRSYGSNEYSATGITRMLDEWVARRIDFRKAKQNYDFLNSMPELVENAIEQHQKIINVLVQKVEDCEKESANNHGFTRVLIDGEKIATSRRALISGIEKNNHEYEQYAAQLKDVENTKGTYHKEAVEKLKGYLKGDAVADLKRRASETPSPEDDNLVDKIEQIDNSVRDLKNKAKQTKIKQKELDEKLRGLNKIDGHYRTNDYDSSRSYFDSGFDINTFLIGYLAGRHTDNSVITSMASHHRFKPRETYSSSSSRSGSSSSSSWDSGFGSSGGFSSGGGFGGGGGFSSGGGF